MIWKGLEPRTTRNTRTRKARTLARSQKVAKDSGAARIFNSVIGTLSLTQLSPQGEGFSFIPLSAFVALFRRGGQVEDVFGLRRLVGVALRDCQAMERFVIFN